MYRQSRNLSVASFRHPLRLNEMLINFMWVEVEPKNSDNVSHQILLVKRDAPRYTSSGVDIR